MYFSAGRCCLELAQALSRVALAWHNAGGSTPSGVTSSSSPGGRCDHGRSHCCFRLRSCAIEACVRSVFLEKRRIDPVARAGGARPGERCILAEGAIALSVTLSGGALFAS